MTKNDIKQLSPILLLTLISVYSIFKVLTTDYTFGIRQILGITLLVISIICFYYNRRIYKYVFGITLILGLINLVGFTVAIWELIVFGLSIQPTLIPIVLLFYIIHRKEIHQKLKYKEKEVDSIASEQRSSILNFRKRLEKLSDVELENRLNENLVPEATTALKLIGLERKLIEPKVSAEFEIEDTFHIFQRGVYLSGKIINGEINMGDYIRFEIEGALKVRRILAVEIISQNPNDGNIGLLLETVNETESNSLINWHPKKVFTEIFAEI